MSDPAIEWFLADAKAQGLSVREYQDKYGILLLPAEHEISAHETALTDAMSATLSVPGPDAEPPSGNKKRRAIKPAASFAPYPDNVIPFPAPREATRREAS